MPLRTGAAPDQRPAHHHHGLPPQLPWATTPAVHSYEKLPAMNEYEGLAKAYAEQARKPARQD
ncbi:hypothetical protein [Archangium sp.]|uniref:hypothetical protein n=1 Tax=Archangium sp. TaxID=1872627 RepID=UPI00286BA8A4|nr:hypothetical protein [Archangium sp.]